MLYKNKISIIDYNGFVGRGGKCHSSPGTDRSRSVPDPVVFRNLILFVCTEIIKLLK